MTKAKENGNAYLLIPETSIRLLSFADCLKQEKEPCPTHLTLNKSHCPVTESETIQGEDDPPQSDTARPAAHLSLS